MKTFGTRRSRALAPLVVGLLLSACTAAPDDLAACRFEAEKIIASIESQHKDELFWNGEERARLVRPCMEAKGYTLDSDHVNRIASVKGFLIENIVSYEPSVWNGRFSQSDKAKIPEKLQQ